MSHQDITSEDIQQSLESLRANIVLREIEKRLSCRSRITDDQVVEILKTNAFRLGLESNCDRNPFLGLHHQCSNELVAEFEKGKEKRL